MALHKFLIEHAIWPAMEKRKGNKIREIQRALEKSQYEDVAALQREGLTELLLHCKAHVPAYESVLPDEDTIRQDPYAALRCVQPLAKRTFQTEAEAHLADNVPQSARIANCTGGSTGEPVRFFMTRAQVESYEAARWRGLGWYGITQGSRSVMLWGSPIELSQQAQLKNRIKESLLKNRQILSAYHLSEQELAKQVTFLNRYKPEYLYGYASILTAFAQMMERRGLSLKITLKAVVSTSETLEPWQEQLLGRVFRCPVANEYGARDAGILAYRCPEGCMHITAENCVIEVLSPKTHEPLGVGKSGVLAVTDLHNFVQPRLRYLLGDVAGISGEACRCGRTLPLLTHVEGREDDLLLGHDGALVHGNIIGQLLRPVPGVGAFQFRQKSQYEARLLLVRQTPDAVIDEASILAQLKKVLPDTVVAIEYVDEIAPTASGKLRYAIRECPLPDGRKTRRVSPSTDGEKNQNPCYPAALPTGQDIR